MSGRTALGANFLILGFLGFSAWLQLVSPSTFYRVAQEDAALEWVSFWSFAFAAAAFGRAAAGRSKETGRFAWFLWGVALFCFIVAMEEVSWGQRVLGLQPGEYFLEKNSQQEINLHNMASTQLRLNVFRAIILGYGVVLPLLAALRPIERSFERAGIVAPPIELMPSMFALFWLHFRYPWNFTGEVVECGLGVAFLFMALTELQRSRAKRGLEPQHWEYVGLPALVVALGFSTAWWSHGRATRDPVALELARAESAALAEDLRVFLELRDDDDSSCGLHKRVYTLVKEAPDAHSLTDGAFAGRVGQGLDATRAAFFVDPWGTSYWVRERCDDKTGQRVVFVYSFGPNRKRDSSRSEILGDDLGAHLIEIGSD